MRLIKINPDMQEIVPVNYSRWERVVHWVQTRILCLKIRRPYEVRRSRPMTHVVLVHFDLEFLKQGRKYKRIKVGDYTFYGFTPVRPLARFEPGRWSAPVYLCRFDRYEKLDERISRFHQALKRLRNHKQP